MIARGIGQQALELIQSLPADQRDAVNARFVNDSDYREIADKLGISEQVARKRVSRGLAALRRWMGVPDAGR
ncbi:MAG: sigma-70 region 4 domain-containing protein [Acidobacteriota bacterium]|nr:sigma-70 region 4 domain-containing protein [Acidobacteriota bacterium]